MNNFQKISVALLLCYAFNLGQFVGSLLKTKLPVEEFFWVLPCMILLVQRFGKRIKLPYFPLFLSVELWMIIIEHNLLIPNMVSSPNLNYSLGILKFYSIYLALLTIQPNKANITYILKLSLKILIPFIVVFYLQYLNIINLSFIKSEEITNRLNVGNLININGISLIAGYGILCVILLLELNPASIRKNWMPKVLFPYFLLIIFLHASRGAFMIAAVLLIIHYRRFLFRPSNFLYLILGIVVFTVLTFFIDFKEDILLINRIFGKTHAGTGRGQQVIATWDNFLKSPFLGMGYEKAGINWELNTVRSNFHYTQLLASYGLFLSGIYFVFLERIFGNGKNNKVAPYSTAFAIIVFASYNWSMILVLAFIAYYNYYGKREKRINQLMQNIDLQTHKQNEHAIQE